MKILVCVKQVIDPDSPLEMKENTLWVNEDKPLTYRMNRYDEYALEEALLLKDADPGVVIDTVSVGTSRALPVLKKTLEKGAHAAFLYLVPRSDLGAHETAAILAQHAREGGYDLILTGVMSEDLMQCLTGPYLAAKLAIPCAVSVVALSYERDGHSLTVESELEGGLIETISLALPCLVTVQTGTRTPRYPSLSNVLRAKSLEVAVHEIGADMKQEPRREVLARTVPVVALHGMVIQGTREEKAGQLLDILHEKSLL